MRRLIIFLTFIVAVLFLATGCLDPYDEDYEKQQEEYQKLINEQFGKDTLIIQQYLADHQLTAQKHESGIYYIIDNQGGDERPNDYSVITVNYKGYLTNDSIFGQTEADTPLVKTLNTFIPGWRIGVPLIGSEGKITLLLPSYYAFGTSSNGKIPANSVVIFDIELLSYY